MTERNASDFTPKDESGRFFLFRRKVWLTAIKVFTLAFIGGLVFTQVPELRYDLSSKKPVDISRPGQLDPDRLDRSLFASVRGTADFDRAFVYKRYGLSYTYFTIEPYGLRLVARTYEEVNEEWLDINRFVGRLRPFEDQPFSYRVRSIYYEQYGLSIPPDAFFISVDDVPKVSGWQVGSVSFVLAIWGILFYFFFIHRKKPLMDAPRYGD